MDVLFKNELTFIYFYFAVRVGMSNRTKADRG